MDRIDLSSRNNPTRLIVKSSFSLAEVDVMGLQPGEIECVRGAGLMLLFGGGAMLLYAAWNWSVGAMSDGDETCPELINREIEPVKFRLLMALTIVAGVVMLLVGAAALLLLVLATMGVVETMLLCGAAGLLLLSTYPMINRAYRRARGRR